MARTEAEPPTPPETHNPPRGAPRHSTAAPERPLLSWPVATVVILGLVLVLLVGGGLLVRQLTGPTIAPTTVVATADVTSAPTLSAPVAPVPPTIAPATLPPANTAVPTQL